MLGALGVPTCEIRQRRDLQQPFDGLIIPGGESTVQGKLLRELGMLEELRARISGGLPVWGTCAGLLLLAKRIANDGHTYLATMDIVAVRNAYGRQLGSFHAQAEFADCGEIPLAFIRAPYISETGAGVHVLSVVDGRIVAARQENQLVTAFHPEVTGDLTVHRYFVQMTAEASREPTVLAASAGPATA
jgi:5'-phosphate synthase pdxT subunit